MYRAKKYIIYVKCLFTRLVILIYLCLSAALRNWAMLSTPPPPTSPPPLRAEMGRPPRGLIGGGGGASFTAVGGSGWSRRLGAGAAAASRGVGMGSLGVGRGSLSWGGAGEVAPPDIEGRGELAPPPPPWTLRRCSLLAPDFDRCRFLPRT